jgi:uncharacterized protein (TIGR03083 family)
MSWNFMEPASRDNIRRVWERESEAMFDLASDPDRWEAPTGAGHWQVRDIIGHIVDTTEAYFVSFDAARGEGDAPGPFGLPDMARMADEGAQRFRDTEQKQLIDRLRDDRDRMMALADELSDEEWAGMMVPHKYMGPLPAAFYPIFQVVDYTVHSWDIREGTGRSHGIPGDAADLLVPLCFPLWQNTCRIEDGEPHTVGIRITAGANAGDTRAHVSAEGLEFEPGSLDDVDDVIEFDPATFVLTAYGRMNAGTYRGDRDVLESFCNLFFRI